MTDPFDPFLRRIDLLVAVLDYADACRQHGLTLADLENSDREDSYRAELHETEAQEKAKSLEARVRKMILESHIEAST